MGEVVVFADARSAKVVSTLTDKISRSPIDHNVSSTANQVQRVDRRLLPQLPVNLAMVFPAPAPRVDPDRAVKVLPDFLQKVEKLRVHRVEIATTGAGKF